MCVFGVSPSTFTIQIKATTGGKVAGVHVEYADYGSTVEILIIPSRIQIGKLCDDDFVPTKVSVSFGIKRLDAAVKHPRQREGGDIELIVFRSTGYKEIARLTNNDAVTDQLAN